MVLDFGCIFPPSPPPRDRATEHNGNGLEAATDGAHVNLYVEMETGNEFLATFVVEYHRLLLRCLLVYLVWLPA